MSDDEVFEALEREQDRIEEMLDGLPTDAWQRESLCPGWTVSDVVLHLAQTEEAVAATVTGGKFEVPASVSGGNVDEIMAAWVAAERGEGDGVVLERWKTARRRALDALRAADPQTPVPWAAAPLKPRTLATTRLSEHWIHAQDVAEPLGVAYPDGPTLWQIARLAHRTIPYAYMRAGRSDPPSVRLELTGPEGEAWVFGDEGADVVIRGDAGELCRIAARRMKPAEAKTIEASGDRSDEVLDLIRTYA
ncbi:MAG TPA: maleylpyruvate isomerase family mycothiol-dependent enzyme [Actinomycetota bacterium]|nr:maleylpyruvate isomerase family mycothiol-dependent enzyme [Actinomycetota bacterium]